MIRVFVLAILALVALVAIARNLPGMQPPEASGEAAAEMATTVEQLSPFARWEGVWEGKLSAFRSDGEPVSSVTVRQVHDTVSETEQTVSIIERQTDGETKEFTGTTLLVDERFERRFLMPDGASVVYAGRREGNAIFWHRLDPVTGLEETIREEIIRSVDGDLYTIDGMRRDRQAGGEILLIQGRYHRAKQGED